MSDVFDHSAVAHVSPSRGKGNAFETVLTPADFANAAAEITAWPGYAETPLHGLTALARQLGVGDILYKDEGPRFGLGSFKALGGAYAALRVLQREITARLGRSVTLQDIRQGKYSELTAAITLVSATDGNHGRSLAWGCQRFGAPCRIYIHAQVSQARAAAMQALGAQVIRIDGDYDASVRLARSEADDNGWFVVSDTSWEGYTAPPRDVMAGYGVMVSEITAKMDIPPSHILLQGGVGGLPAAVCAGLRQHWADKSPRVIVVEPDRADCLFASAQAGALTHVEIQSESMMAGLSCGTPSGMAWQILREEVSDFVTVSDDIVGATMRLLARPTGTDPAIRAGESAVAGLGAAIQISRRQDLRSKLGFDGDSQLLVIGSEGVTDPEIYAQIMQGDT